MAASNAKVKSVNCGVSPNKNDLIFKLTDELATGDIVFKIEPAEDGEIGVLEIRKGEPLALIRQYKSNPFPSGLLKVKNQGLETVEKVKIYRVVLVKEKKNIDLTDYFE